MERGRHLEVAWYDSGEEIVIVWIRSRSSEGHTGSASGLMDRRPDDGRRRRALMVTNEQVAAMLERRGWRRDGRDFIYP